MVDVWGESWSTSWADSWAESVAPPVAPVPPGKHDGGAGAGTKQTEPWWTGEWITPGVDAYLPAPPPDDITPLRPQQEALKERAKAAAPPVEDDYYREITRALTNYAARIKRLEARAAEAVEQAVIDKVIERYRGLIEEQGRIEDLIRVLEERERRRLAIIADDEVVIQLVLEAMK